MTVRVLATLMGFVSFLLLSSAIVSASPSLPSPDELPPDSVAVVLRSSGASDAVAKSDFDRFLVQAAVRNHFKQVPKPGQRGYERLKFLALGDLLDGRWIEGQAAEMGLIVTHQQVARQLAQIKAQNFKNAGAYKRFLHRTHLTQGDVNEDVRLQILSQDIQAQVLRGIRGNRARIRTFRRFVAQYDKRWRARTVCARGYVFNQCSNWKPPIVVEGP